MTLRFNATIEIYNGNPYILVNATRATQLKTNWRKPMPVLVQINGKPGRFMARDWKDGK